VVALAARRLKFPYSVGLVVAGIVLALSLVQIGISLTPEFIFTVLLPPLLFEASLNIRWSELRREMLPVLSLAVGGVVISAAVTAAGMVYVLGWPWQVACVFGALIAATDPVSVIALFKEVGLEGRLRLLMESESFFNDGVAAVLFEVALRFGQAAGQGAVGAIAEQFLLLTAGGLVVGALCGALGLLVAHRTDDYLVETALTAVIAYGSFLLAQSIGVSGVLATVTAGLWIGNIGIRNRDASITAHGRFFVLEFWKFAAFLADSVMFLLIGLRVAEVSFSSFGGYALFIAVALVVTGRALAVYPISWLFSRTRFPIPYPDSAHYARS
jgi:monovalent cation:H+ antiporter, CPA1 family